MHTAKYILFLWNFCRLRRVLNIYCLWLSIRLICMDFAGIICANSCESVWLADSLTDGQINSRLSVKCISEVTCAIDRLWAYESKWKTLTSFLMAFGSLLYLSISQSVLFVPFQNVITLFFSGPVSRDV